MKHVKLKATAFYVVKSLINIITFLQKAKETVKQK